jgi:hypothetical protein
MTTTTNVLTEQIRILSSGYVGINVTDPDVRLEVLDGGVAQLKLSFDGVDNCTFAVDGSGHIDITPSGGNVTVSGNLDVEGYAAFGNGGALNAARTVLIDRDFSGGGSIQNQLRVSGLITATSGASNIHHTYLIPDGTVINSGSAHAFVTTLALFEPVITETSGSVTTAATLYVATVATEATRNYAVFVNDGECRLDGTVVIGGPVTAAAQLHVDQASTTAAIPVLTLDQADASEEYINFISAATGAGNPIDTATAVGAAYARARVAVNGTFKYIQLYDA